MMLTIDEAYMWTETAVIIIIGFGVIWGGIKLIFPIERKV
jgi:hypothetical protein